MFIKAYVGQYYAKKFGLVGDEPINLIFHTIRAMVPNLVMKSPVNKVGTNIVEYEDYAYMLSLALDQLNKTLKFKDILRYGIVDAMFGMAVFKTGLAKSGVLLNFGDTVLDEGQVYIDNVSLDDYVFDTSCRVLGKPLFEGDRNRISRQILLDDDRMDHDRVIKLPKSTHPDAGKRVEAMTQSGMANSEIYELQDFVDVVELFIPEANALVTIADPHQTIMDEYLGIQDYYGPKEGPYTKLALTQPVPDNPFPIAPVSIWFDMHHIANKVMKKMMTKADRQKDLIIVDPAGADEGEDIRTSDDGDVMIGNPDTVKAISIGGAKQEDSYTMSALKEWYNYISGNPDQMSGDKAGAKTATGQSILDTNMNIGIEDLRSMVYDCSADLNRKMAWYLHTDPFIKLPIPRRQPGGKTEQMVLTPEERRGDFLDFFFTIKQRSMTRLSPDVRAKRIMEFGTRVMPGIMTAGQIAMQMGVQFDVKKSLTDIADEMGILDEVQDWFVDPAFMQRLQLMLVMGPQNAGKAGTMGTSPAGVMQNQGSPMAGAPQMDQSQQMNQQFQQGANQSQSNIQGVY